MSIFALAIVLTVVVAIVATAIAFRSNGYSAWLGALVGLVFGIPGLVISLVVFAVAKRPRTT